MKKTTLLAGALALALLAGCGGPAASTPQPASTAVSFQTADLLPDAPLFTVDGQAVSAEEYLFWLLDAIHQQGLTAESDWTADAGEVGTVSDAVKADALETCKYYQVIRNKAAEYGLTVTDEDRTLLDEQMEQLLAQLGGEQALQDALDEQCISLEGFNAINSVYFLNQHIRDKLEADGVISVTEADLDQFIQDQGFYAAKHILVSTRRDNGQGAYEDFSPEEKAAALDKANGLYDQIMAADAGQREAVFDQLMNEFSEDGRYPDGTLAAPDGYTLVWPGQMVSQFEEGALALEVGQVSQPVETAYGYHIILRIPVDRDQAQSYFGGTNAKLAALVQQWADQAEVVPTAAYDALDPKDFYTRIQALNDARTAQRQAEATPAPSESPSDAPTESPSDAPTESQGVG